MTSKARTVVRRAGMVLLGLVVTLLAFSMGAAPAAAQDDEFLVDGRLFLRVDPDEPVIIMRSRWVFFPREEYPWENIETDQEARVDIHPAVLTAYVNAGCHFEGYVKWNYEETEVEVLSDGWVRRRLRLTRGEQGGFFNNDLKFKCELLTKNKAVNRRLGQLATMGQAPTSGFQMGISMVALMKVLDAINTLDRTEGTWGDYLYRTFKSMMTFDLMDEDVREIDLYFSPEGDELEFEIEGERTAVFTH